MTSGNISEEPPVVDDAEAGRSSPASPRMRSFTTARSPTASTIPSCGSWPDNPACFAAPAASRRARSSCRADLRAAPELTALGGELKATFCLVKDGQAILSQHLGDLENAATFDDYRKSLALYRQLFAHEADRARGRPASRIPVVEIGARGGRQPGTPAICMCNITTPMSPPVSPRTAIRSRRPLFSASSSMDWASATTGRCGAANSCWRIISGFGGWRGCGRSPCRAGRRPCAEPWRNLYAHLTAAIGWAGLTARFAALDLHVYLDGKPRALLDAMIAKQMNAPPASSCGRLFDAVAAALGICRERQAYEGEAAMRLEALAERARSSAADAEAAYRSRFRVYRAASCRSIPRRCGTCSSTI